MRVCVRERARAPEFRVQRFGFWMHGFVFRVPGFAGSGSGRRGVSSGAGVDLGYDFRYRDQIFGGLGLRCGLKAAGFRVDG